MNGTSHPPGLPGPGGRRRPERSRARRRTARRRDPTRIIDKGDGIALQTRAIGIHARTLEVLDMMGLADRFTECGHAARHLRSYSQSRCLASLELARCGSRFGFLLDLPQEQTERLLRARITEPGYLESWLGAAGLTDSANVDFWRALLTGLAGQKLANDPGGARWIRLAERAIDGLPGPAAPRARKSSSGHGSRHRAGAVFAEVPR
jgi:hypothetical protein